VASVQIDATSVKKRPSSLRKLSMLKIGKALE
jgi:hypothetical protein